MIFASIVEVISIGAVLPFLGVLTSPEHVFNNNYIQVVLRMLEQRFDLVMFTEPNQIVLPITIIFILATLLAGIIRLTLLYVMTRLSYATGADISIDIYRRTLYQEYSVHLMRNSSEVINGVINKSGGAIGVIHSSLTIFSSIIILIGIMIALFAVDTKMAFSALIGFGSLYWFIVRYTRKQIKENSQIIATKSTTRIKSLQEGLGGIRDVLINSSQEFYCNLYRQSDLPIRRVSGNNAFIGNSPRYVMEAIGMTIIAILAYQLTYQPGGVTTAIPVLGALALGAQRLLPVLQQLYSAYISIKGSRSSFQDVIGFLEQPLPHYIDQVISPIVFEKHIQLQNVSFRYTKSSPLVIENIDLRLDKGARIGFIGVTGSGKSTMLDIVMGLLTPTNGKVTIDSQVLDDSNIRSWQVHLAHVPQSIYLADSTIEENIAFGIQKEKINHEQVKKAAEQAQIIEQIEKWKDGYQTIVGEQGIRLSGGQRQRIGIARALYRQANVLVFDEATSALDNETENEVMEAIENLGRELTVLIIAHRLTTLRNCDQIVKLDKEHVLYTGSYNDMVNA